KMNNQKAKEDGLTRITYNLYNTYEHAGLTANDVIPEVFKGILTLPMGAEKRLQRLDESLTRFEKNNRLTETGRNFVEDLILNYLSSKGYGSIGCGQPPAATDSTPNVEVLPEKSAEPAEIIALDNNKAGYGCLAASLAAALFLTVSRPGNSETKYTEMQNRMYSTEAKENLEDAVDVWGKGAGVFDMDGKYILNAKGGWAYKLVEVPENLADGLTWGAYDPKTNTISWDNLGQNLKQDGINLGKDLGNLLTVGIFPVRGSNSFSERIKSQNNIAGKVGVALLYLPSNIYSSAKNIIFDDFTPIRSIANEAVLQNILFNTTSTVAYSASDIVRAVYNGTVRLGAEKIGNETFLAIVDNGRAYTLDAIIDGVPGTHMSKAVHAGNKKNAPIPFFGHLIQNSRLKLSFKDTVTGETVTYEAGDV
ncbi:MAG: hypothetical protein KAU20_03805, partial [Nanoarchaeota archaeon]|nr:hypothetical protein [Nanoarchaeota archaeon]